MLDLTRLLADAPPREGQPRVRMSNLGKCDRALAYILHGVPADGREIDARAARVFAFGDAVEELLVRELQRVLPEGWRLEHVLEDQQTVTLRLGAMTVTGHPDGMLVSPEGRRYVLEIKSASSYGFRQMEEHGLDPSETYYHQHQAYLAATRADGGVFVAMAKDSGAVCHFWTTPEPGWLGDADERVTRLMLTSPDAVERRLPDGSALEPLVDLHKTRGTPNKKHGKLPWQCVYCSHYRRCWGEALEERVDRDWRGAPSRQLYIPRHGLDDA